MSSRFTQYILIAMALGIVMGSLVFNYLPDSRAEIAADVNLIAMLFLRLIKMIIAPLVFATLVGGIARNIRMGTEQWASHPSLPRRRFPGPPLGDRRNFRKLIPCAWQDWADAESAR